VLTLALAHFAQAIGAGKSKQVLLVLDDLEVAQVQRCAVLQNQPDVIRSHTLFHWWPPSNSKHQ
jgi:hypothetical protein